MTEISFDAIIPYHPKDDEILSYCIQGLRMNVKGLRKIFIISQDDPQEEDTIWIPESKFPFSKQQVREAVRCTNGREGWYLQQLLKLYCVRVLGKELLPTILLIDSDVVICRPISFCSEDSKLYFDWTEDTHKPYFPVIQRVLGDEFQYREEWKSGIADHMIIRTDHLEQLLKRIEDRAGGDPAWAVLLREVDLNYANTSGMSEFEMIYIFCLTLYPDHYKRRQLNRTWTQSFHDIQTGSYDMAIFHSWIRDGY